MNELIVQRQAVNLEALDAALRAALGELVVGVSLLPGEIVVYLDSAAPQDIEQARALILAHDPAQLTPAQQAAADRAAYLDQLRQQNAEPLDPAGYAAESDLIRKLAEKVAWLEAEVRSLLNL